MNNKLALAFKKIEQRRKRLLDDVAKIPEDVFYFAPSGKWSISQILVHLILAEKLSLQYIKKKSLGISSAGETNFLDDMKYLGLKLSQRLPLKYKAPKVLGESAPEKLPLHDIISRWNNLRSDLESFLETLEDAELHKKIYKHAIAGRLNILHAIDFFNEHLIHHTPQILRLMKGAHRTESSL